jgi:hypothetical protein
MQGNLPEDLDDRIDTFRSKEFHEITDGLPFRTSEELFELLYKNYFMMHRIMRLPILATKEGRIYIQSNNPSGRMEHRELRDSLIQAGKIKSDDEILYATAIENFSFEKPTSGMYISLPVPNKDKLIYWKIKNGSDHFLNSAIARNPDFITSFAEMIEKIKGVTFTDTGIVEGVS